MTINDYVCVDHYGDVNFLDSIGDLRKRKPNPFNIARALLPETMREAQSRELAYLGG